MTKYNISKTNKYKSIIFDVDDTIRDFTKEDQIILEKTQKDLNIKFGFPILIVKLIEVIALYMRSFGIVKANMKSLDLRLMIHAAILNVDIRRYKAKYYENTKKVTIPFKNTKTTLDYLRKCGFNLYIATNNPKSIHFCKSMGFTKDYIFITQDKNNKKHTIESLIKKENLNINEVLVVGDSLSEDVRSANLLKIDSVWINHDNRLKKNFAKIIKPNYIISDIIQILELLE